VSQPVRMHALVDAGLVGQTPQQVADVALLKRTAVELAEQAPATVDAQALRGCLESVKNWAREIIVVDSGSSDETAAIAREYTDRVLTSNNRLMLEINKNRAIEAAGCEWILVLDPDERVSPELAQELLAIAELGADGPAGYRIPRRTYKFGRWVRTMGFYPDHQLRFVRNGRGRFPAATSMRSSRCAARLDISPATSSTAHRLGWPRRCTSRISIAGFSLTHTRCTEAFATRCRHGPGVEAGIHLATPSRWPRRRGGDTPCPPPPRTRESRSSVTRADGVPARTGHRH
jgi:glycosyltransferase involved in cell wall biosynthesis